MLERLETLIGRSSKPVPPTCVFYLRPDDDVTSVLDRLNWTDAGRVALVMPPDAAVLTDRLDLLRVQRRAGQRGVELALITAEPAQREMARELGIPLVSSVERAETRHWQRRRLAEPPRRSRGERISPQELRPGDSRLSGYILTGLSFGVVMVLLYDLLTIGRLDVALLRKDAPLGAAGGTALGLLVFLIHGLLRRYTPRVLRGLRYVAVALLFVFGVLAPVGAGYIIVPSARLVLTPARTSLSAIARVTVVVPLAGQEAGLEEIDFEGLRISGRRVSAEVSGEAVAGATGVSDVPSSRATGTVVFSNLLAQDYTVGKGTAVRTSAGTPVRFLTAGDVTVPPLGQAAVGIEAVEPGPTGNVDVGLINRIEGAAARAVRVTNPEPTRGGGLSQVRAVTQEDREALRRTLLAQLRGRGYTSVLARPEAEGGLREGEYLVPGSVRVLQVLHETYDRFATEEAESVKLEMRVQVTGVVIDLGDAYNLARYVLTRRVPQGFKLVQEQYRPGMMGDNVLGDGTLTFFVEAEGVAEAQLPHEQVKRWLRGKPYAEGVAALEIAWQDQTLPVAQRPEIELGPDWAQDRFPWLLWRIQVLEAKPDES